MLAKRHCDLGRLKNKACCRLHALLLEVVAGGAPKRISVTRANTIIDAITTDNEMTRQRVEICRELIEDIARLDSQLAASQRRVRSAVAASGSSLEQICGIGPICAAMIIGQSGNIDRFPTRNHYATYNATAPIEASSGPTKRHRLNPRGNRQLNWAIHVIAISQLRHDTPGRAYYDRKVAQGKTTKEAIRTLKRRISDVVYRHLVADAKPTST